MAKFTLAKLPWYGQIGAFVLISVIAAGAFYYFYDKPQQTEIATQAKEQSDIRGRISKGQSMARQLPEFTKRSAPLKHGSNP